jgi:O-antigen/teichoic acid export membrane protein
MAAWRARSGRSRFARNALTVARANLLAQALPLLAAPLLTRLYSPADFGTLALFVSALGVVQALSTGRFDWSVPNAKSSTMAAALLVLGGAVLVAVIAAMALIGLIGLGWTSVETSSSGLAGHDLGGALRSLGGWSYALLTCAVLGGGLQQLLQSWHVRSADLAAVGRAKVMQSVANVGVALAAAPLIPGSAGLLLGVLAGAWVGLSTVWRRAQGLEAALRRLNRRRLTVAWLRFRREAAWSTLVSAVNTASFAVIPLLLARHWSVAEVGWYALMQRVALAPIGLVGSAVSQSFWAEAARLVRVDRHALALLYQRSSWRLLGVSLPIAAAALAGPLYIGWIFGDAWRGAGWVLAASVPMLIGQVVASPLSHLVVHGRQHWQAAWDCARIGLLALTIAFAGSVGLGIVAAVAALSLLMAAMYGVLIALNLRALRG